jgi:RNA polymerase sigma factor (sigma-70 family)
MMPMDDSALLQEYARSGTESAFDMLVRRHIGLVYSAARRQVRDPQHAEDVTQAVFIVLARKAGQVARHPGLSGWLLQTTRYASNAHIRTTDRRVKREQEAAMQSDLNDSSPAIWAQLEPHLDEAMASLGATDRAVLAMRYFENKTAAEIAKALQLNEEAAKKRAIRALEKLRKFLGKKGLTLSAGAIAATVSTNAVQAAPTALASAVTAVAISGTTLTSATILAATKTITMTTLQKIAVTVALTVTIGGGVYAAKQARDARAEVQKLQVQQAPLTGQIKQLQDQLVGMTNQLVAMGDQSSKNQREDPDLLKLRGQVGVFKRQAEEADQKAKAAEQKLAELLSVKTQFAKSQSTMVSNAKEVGLAMLLFAVDNGDRLPTDFLQITNQLGGYDKLSKMGVYEFDLLNVGTDGHVDGINVKNLANSAHPDMVVLRERMARQSPDGSWNRIYGYLDGRVVVATSYDGNFDAWEKANTYTPPPSLAN